MQAIHSILALHQQGNDIADLHAALDKLDFGDMITPQERAENRFGEGTAESVRRVQGQFGIQTARPGEVDQQTANLINQRLFETGVFRLVEGRVANRDGSAVAGNLVFAFDRDNIGGAYLGMANTNEDGHYSTYYDPLLYARAGEGVLRVKDIIDLIVQVYDAAGTTLAESQPLHDPGQRVQVDLRLRDLPAGEAFTVDGTVSSRSRAGVGGLRVVIVDKNVGEDVHLKETETNDRGNYQVTFPITGLQERCKQQPDLQARAFAGEKFLGASEVRYNASNRETLNILLTKEADSALPSEHETLVGALTSQCRTNLRDLQETDDRQDITYLANKTGWDARAVALAALAEQFSDKTSDANGHPRIQPAFFYALFRAGLPANEAAIYQADARTAEAIWKQAIAQGVIPASLENSIPQALGHFQSLAVERALDTPPLAGISSLKDMLSVSLGNDRERQQQFAALYTQHRADPDKLWASVRDNFGEAAEKRLRLDGQLSYLTFNNAPLIQKLHETAGQGGLTQPLDLVDQGYHRADKWKELVGNGAIPPEIRGKDDAEKRENYAELMAAQVRLSFPTAVVAEVIKEIVTPAANLRLAHNFLREHHSKFEIGMQPVEQYISRNNLQVAEEVTQAAKQVQRVYQITPSDSAMAGLLKKGVDSAYAVTRYDRDEFVRTFKDEIGGEENALLTYAKAQQVHNAVLNIATSYLIAKTASPIGVHSPPKIIDQAPKVPANAGDVIAYPDLESLFGEMDYCTCEHCRSILSPAAYLVNLLQFIEPDPGAWTSTLAKWKPEHGGAPYPYPDMTAWNKAGNPTNTEITPLQVLLSRRPDIEHLPLSCENTNTPLPYIDLVNETLEYFVFNKNKLSLEKYEGHSTDGDATPEELLASPQFGYTEASVEAYKILAAAHFPPSLPFHQPLENLRRYFDRFEAPLPEVMEALHKDDSLERANANEYGWRDILMEELCLSRAEYALLTDRTLTLRQLYGYPAATPLDDVLSGLSNVKAFTQRIGITYEDIIEILKTRFINPNSTLIPKLERLGVPFATLKTLKESPLTGQAWLDLLPKPLPDASQYGDNIEAWVKNDANYARIMGLITLANPTNPENVCSFDDVRFRYANPAKINDPIRVFEFVSMIRFLRLRKKLGWTIEQTDKAITALYPLNQIPNDPNDAVNLQRLDDGFLILLPRLGVIKRVMDVLTLKPQKDLMPLLACFAPIDTHGAVSLYRQMFLSPALLKFDDAFKDDGYGNFLDGSEKLLGHKESLRAAFQLADDEFSLITSELRYDDSTTLTNNNVSPVFRLGWLARKIKLSVRELLMLTRFTGIDPFVIPAFDDANKPVDLPILRLIELVDKLRAASLKPVQALYLIWNQDISGKSVPEDGEISGFARTLRSNFTTIESEFALTDDPDGQIARARMALVYGNEVTDLFFGLLGNTLVTEVHYSHGQATLAQAILNAAPGRIAYDDFRKRLSFTGILTTTVRDALKVGVPLDFEKAVESLYAENQKVIGPFFASYPELLPLYDAYTFFGELSSSIDYTHSQATLEQAIRSAASDRIAYDNASKRLSFKGVLTNAVRNALRGVPGFQTAIDDLYAANQATIQSFFTSYPTLLVPQQAAYLAANDSIEQRRSVLLASFLPELKRRRKRQQALQDICAAANSDVGFATAVLDDANVLHAVGDIARPAHNDLTALEKPGLSAQFFFRSTATGNVDRAIDTEPNLSYSATGSNKLPSNPVPANAISGIWSGYLEAPENGFYNIRIEADAGATVALSLGDATIDLEPSGNVWTNNTPIELTSGTLYDISLTVEKVKDTMNIRWETLGRGRGIIPPRYLYSATLTDHLRATYVRFLKVSSLATGLKLTANEISYFAGHKDYKIGGHGWLNSLQVTGSPNNDTSIALFKPLTTLLDFTRIKASLSPDDERLLSVLQNPEATLPSGGKLLLTLTRWESGSLDALLVQFEKVTGGNADRNALKDMSTFCRVYDAYVWVKKMGIPASALIKATTNEPDADTVSDLQAALRARYNENDWLNVLKPINDQMRGLQRDALVAYILHQMRADPDFAHIDTPDKLFEYFLMDVQMAPCMQTSRIRHALSSVQLFIERCLMDLESRVASSSIKAEQWKWMKRYRVWEANRKVFIWPENWLEPELRDNQSPFFKETMSELLQGDITEDRAAVALLNYLSKLQEVAKLEPCGIHYVEKDPSKREDDIAHVVARTAGANRKYFYRRREPSGWSPWEQIKLDIEDNPVIPVVWKGRLFLFWARILKEANMDLDTQPKSYDKVRIWSEPTTPLTEQTTGQLKQSAIDASKKNTEVVVKAVLCWSEYYNGKWQPTKTSDINRPTELDSFATFAFDRSMLVLSVAEELNALRVSIWNQGQSSFVLYNTHSLPVRQEEAPQPGVTLSPKQVGMYTLKDTLIVSYYSQWPSASGVLTRQVLKNALHDRTIQPRHILQNAWDAPFFYEDSRHVFYVTNIQENVEVRKWNKYSIPIIPQNVDVKIPPVLWREKTLFPDKLGPFVITPQVGVSSPSPIEGFVSEDAYISRAIATTGTVAYGGKQIGPLGIVHSVQQAGDIL